MENNEVIYITGHKNPDTDSIVSALVAEYLFKKLGVNVKANKQGEVSKETQFVLEACNLEAPETNISFKEGTHVILVDHNAKAETLDNIDELIIDRVIDHHAVKLMVGYPLYYRAEPVGCTNTILYKMYVENNVEIPQNIAKAMLSAIISDTLLFKSPTCTEEDKIVAKELEHIAKVDAKEYGMELLKAGTDLSAYTIDEILNLDAKTVEIGDTKGIVAQITTADIPKTMEMQNDLEEGIKNIIGEKGLDFYILLVTDIINSDSQVIALGEKAEIVEKAYNDKLENNTMLVKGLVSRKKQVIPVITEVVNGNN